MFMEHPTLRYSEKRRFDGVKHIYYLKQGRLTPFASILPYSLAKRPNISLSKASSISISLPTLYVTKKTR